VGIVGGIVPLKGDHAPRTETVRKKQRQTHGVGYFGTGNQTGGSGMRRRGGDPGPHRPAVDQEQPK